jgi:Outer membrane receptor for ferric coprogen and ferric-rhodotorulic acid
LNANRSLLYRFDLVYKNNDTFIDFVDEERIFAAPALTWRPGERTEFNLNLEYQHDESRYYAGIPAVGRHPAPIPISRYLGFGADNEFQTFDKVLVGFDWSPRFTDAWTLRQRFHYYFYDYVFNNTWFGLGVADDGRSFTRALYHFPIVKGARLGYFHNAHPERPPNVRTAYPTTSCATPSFATISLMTDHQPCASLRL